MRHSVFLFFLCFVPSSPLLNAQQSDAEANEVAEEEPQPYWYQPGHPLDPAEAAGITSLPGFEVHQCYAVPEDQGSWTAITSDDRGRLICAAQHQPGLYRLTRSETDSDPCLVQPMKGVAAKIGWCHGLLHAFNSLYVTVGEENDFFSAGLYRLQDQDGDDEYETAELIVPIDTHGEHGAHNVVVGPEGKRLYMMCGNGTPVPPSVQRFLPSSTDGVDHLMPPGFESSEYTTAGFVLRINPDGSDPALLCGGLRNSFDLAFHRNGELFTFDSDMEWDLGAPWYRPTRICHLVSGGEFGWRNDAAKWPEYYEDSVKPVLNIGPGSPTGVAFGYGSSFPSPYRNALFVGDWTFAAIYAVHLEPDGATYKAKYEEFVGGAGLPVTDFTFAADGNLYFLVGGRRLGSAVYRVRYKGSSDAQTGTERSATFELNEEQRLRKRLERFHGVVDSNAIEAAWPLLASPDRALRFAARIALESQPVDRWANKVFQEKDTSVKLMGLLALARKSNHESLIEVIDHLESFRLDSLRDWQLLVALRTLELCVARRGESAFGETEKMADALNSIYPHTNEDVNRELARMMSFLQHPSAIDKLLDHMAEDKGKRPTLGKVGFERNAKYGESVKDILVSAPMIDRMHDAQMLLWAKDGWNPESRRRYFELMVDAVDHSKGGHWYQEFWSRIRTTALDEIPEPERATYDKIRFSEENVLEDQLPKPEGPGKKWTRDDVLAAITSGFRGRDHERGKRMYSAAKCITCHRFGNEGKSLGPELSQVGQRFKIQDIVESTVDPNRAISDQYAVTIFLTVDGETITGRVLSRDANQVIIATNLERPGETTKLPLDEIEEQITSRISTMPTGLLDSLNENEVLDLIAYLVSGGDENHPVFQRQP